MPTNGHGGETPGAGTGSVKGLGLVLLLVDLGEWGFYLWGRQALPQSRAFGALLLLVAALQFFGTVAWLIRGAAGLSWQRKLLVSLLASNGCIVALLL